MTVLVTMAGEGERFRRAGFPAPKYRIEACGRTLFAWAMESLRGLIGRGARFVFAARAEHEPEAFLAGECGRLGIRGWRLARIHGRTAGQAATAKLALEAVPVEEGPLAIYNIDTYVEPDALGEPPAGAAGWIPCFEAGGDGWSFVRAGAGGRVLEVAEKRRISADATVGLYWFGSPSLFLAAYAEDAGAGSNCRGELYVAPLYNRLLDAPGGVWMTRIPASAVHPMGTPAELEQFVRERGA